jgi:hypothetical protein
MTGGGKLTNIITTWHSYVDIQLGPLYLCSWHSYVDIQLGPFHLCAWHGPFCLRMKLFEFKRT